MTTVCWTDLDKENVVEFQSHKNRLAVAKKGKKKKSERKISYFSRMGFVQHQGASTIITLEMGSERLGPKA